MKLKQISIAVGIFLFFLTITYVYLNENEALLVGVGIDSNTNEVLLEFSNNTIFPIFVDDVIVKNENDTDVGGKEFMYRLNSNQIMVFSDELEGLKDDVEFLEPFTTLYIQADKNNTKNSIFIKEGTFNKINKVEVKIRVLGFSPFQISKNVDLVKSIDE